MTPSCYNNTGRTGNLSLPDHASILKQNHSPSSAVAEPAAMKDSVRCPVRVRLRSYKTSIWRKCRAADPQAHMQDPEPRPICRLLVTCSCCWTAWLYPPEAMFNGEPAPSPDCFKHARQSARTENAKLIAAAVIAAIRLNREEIKN